MKKVILMLSMVFIAANLLIVPATKVGAQENTGSANGSVNVANPFEKVCESDPTSSVCQSSNDDFGTIMRTVSNTLLYILGAVAVLTIITSGIRYATSHGDPGAIASAKNTLFYAVIGLIVALSAYAIVNFIAERFWPSNTGTEKETAKISLTI